jgi:eukaryotic-like serine/threonine-protein kinase
VLKQDRSAGLVPQGAPVTLTVATAATTATIPTDLVGKSEEDATARLQALGFVVVSQGATSNQYDEGNVMAVSPSGGTSAALGSTVTLTVSEGRPSGSSTSGSGG